jgi:hypothetical protein
MSVTAASPAEIIALFGEVLRCVKAAYRTP